MSNGRNIFLFACGIGGVGRPERVGCNKIMTHLFLLLIGLAAGAFLGYGWKKETKSYYRSGGIWLRKEPPTEPKPELPKRIVGRKIK